MERRRFECVDRGGKGIWRSYRLHSEAFGACMTKVEWKNEGLFRLPAFRVRPLRTNCIPDVLLY